MVAVGGTSLTVKGTNPGFTYGSESAWGDGVNSGMDGGGGGGISNVESLPSYQGSIVSQYSTTNRTYPDVSMEAEPATGVPLYDTYNNDPASPWSNNWRHQPGLSHVGRVDRHRRPRPGNGRSGIALWQYPDAAGSL